MMTSLPVRLVSSAAHYVKICCLESLNTDSEFICTMCCSTSISDRFYDVLYRKLSDPALATTSKQAMFLHLLYKSIMRDNSDDRVKVCNCVYTVYFQSHKWIFIGYSLRVEDG